MNIQDGWEKALRKTEIVRPRVQALHTFQATHLPYLFLSESAVNVGDTVVRKGEVLVEKPAIVLPFNMPHFEGFDFEKEVHLSEELLSSFFLVRGVTFPSFKYNNTTHTTDVYQGRLSQALQHYSNVLQRDEDVHAGLVTGSDDCWQFSILIFIASQIHRSADSDFKKLFEDQHRRGLMS